MNWDIAFGLIVFLFFGGQSITTPREAWYWPEVNADEEEDDLEEEEKEEEEEEGINLTVSIQFYILKMYIFKERRI